MEQGASGDFRVSPRAQYLGRQLVMSSKANCFPCWKAWPQAMMGKYTKYWHESTNGLPIPRKAGLCSHGSALQTQRSAHQNQQACMSCRVITQGMSQKLHGADGFYLRAISILQVCWCLPQFRTSVATQAVLLTFSLHSVIVFQFQKDIKLISSHPIPKMSRGYFKIRGRKNFSLQMKQPCEKGGPLLLIMGRDEEDRTHKPSMKASGRGFHEEMWFCSLRISSIFLRPIILIHCFMCK